MGTTHVDKPLTNFSRKLGQGGMIADMLAPFVDVKNETGDYFTYGEQDKRIFNTLRADKADLNFADMLEYDIATYRCSEYQLADMISKRDRDNADMPLQLDVDMVENLTAVLNLGREQRVSSTLTLPATYGANTIDLSDAVTAGANMQWNDESFDSDSKDGSIEARIDAAKEAIRIRIGFEANTIVIPPATAKVMKRDSEIKSLRKDQDQSLLINGDLPPTLFNLRVVTPGALYDSADYGQTVSLGDLWGNDVIVAYVNPRPNTKSTTLMSTFRSQRFEVMRFRLDIKKTDVVSVSNIMGEEIVSAVCGYLIQNPIA